MLKNSLPFIFYNEHGISYTQHDGITSCEKNVGGMTSKLPNSELGPVRYRKHTTKNQLYFVCF